MDAQDLPNAKLKARVPMAYRHHRWRNLGSLHSHMKPAVDPPVLIFSGKFLKYLHLLLFGDLCLSS